MKKIIALLCLGIIGCARPPQITKNTTLVNELELDSVISVFSAALISNPNYAGAYYNRAVAYFYKKNYRLCWLDVHMAESLGYRFKDSFIKELKKASKRER